MDFPMVLTGDTSVVDAFYEPSARLAIVTCAGGNRNAMTSGAFISLRKRRLINRPDAFAGVSSGIATMAYFMGNGVAPDVKVFSNDMSGKQLFDITRRLRGQYPFDVDYVERVFRGTETNRGIRAHNVSKHRSPLYAILGHAVSGEPIIHKAGDAEDVWKISAYSTAITGFARPLIYQGKPVTDGYFTTEHLPVEWLLHKEKPTDVLVFAGRDFDPNPRLSHWAEHILYACGFAPASRSIRNLIRNRHIRFMETAKRIVELPNTRVLIVWVPEKLSQINIKEEKSRELIRMGYWTMEELFKQRRL